MGDESGARRIVLARRARFIAAALAGIGAACGKDERTPFEDAAAPGTDAARSPEPDAEPYDASSWTIDADSEGGTPIPCLPMIIMSLNERRMR